MSPLTIGENDAADHLTFEPSCKDEMRVGQKNKLTYRWARKGSRPRAAHDQRPQSPYLFGAVCPERAPATRTRTQRPRKYLAIHAAELVVEPNFQILRRHRRSLLLRLEHAHRSAVENHVHRPPRLGSRRSLNLRIGIIPSRR